MSHTIIYGARVRQSGALAQVQLRCRDNNVRPHEGRHSDGLSFASVRELPTGDPEACAVWFEKLARDYDSGSIKEGVRYADGYRAYELWRGRFQAGTGITLRDPRWASLYYQHVPPGLFSGEERIVIEKGTRFSPEDASSFITRFPTIRLAVRVQGAQCRDAALGFFSHDRPCVYRKGFRRGGFALDEALTVTAAVSFDSWRHRPWMTPALVARPEFDPGTGSAWSVIFVFEDEAHILTEQDDAIGSCAISSASWQRVAGFSRAGAEDACRRLGSLLPGPLFLIPQNDVAAGPGDSKRRTSAAILENPALELFAAPPAEVSARTKALDAVRAALATLG